MVHRTSKRTIIICMSTRYNVRAIASISVQFFTWVIIENGCVDELILMGDSNARYGNLSDFCPSPDLNPPLSSIAVNSTINPMGRDFWLSWKPLTYIF